MRIILVHNYAMPHLGVMYISAILQQHGHNCKILVDSLEKDTLGKIMDIDPDIVGFFCFTGNHNWVVETAQKIKDRKHLPIIVGGPHPTYFPDFIKKDPIDMVCVGEGEEAMLELVERIKRDEEITDIKNIWVKRDGTIYKNEVRELISDLDALPFADWESYREYPKMFESNELLYQSSRGCPYQCNFCCNEKLQVVYKKKGNVFRFRSVDNIIFELKRLVSSYNINFICFVDELWGVNKEWAKELSKKYKKEIGLPFLVAIRPNLINREIVSILKEAGCYCISMGIESGNEQIRRDVLNKRVKDSEIIEAAKIVKEGGILLRTTNMFNIPGEDLQKAYDTLYLNIKVKADFPWCYQMQPYPGTKILEIAKEMGCLDKDYDYDNIDPIATFDSPIKLKDSKRIKNLHRFFILGIKMPSLLFLIGVLIKLPPNPIFDVIHKISIGVIYSKYHRLSYLEFAKRSIGYLKAYAKLRSVG